MGIIITWTYIIAVLNEVFTSSLHIIDSIHGRFVTATVVDLAGIHCVVCREFKALYDVNSRRFTP
jgi:hypothetical protein